jgi:hypothetical protein
MPLMNFKDCYDEFNGGLIAMVPENELTKELSTFFTEQNISPGTKFFKDDQSMDDYVRDINYGGKGEKAKERICFAVSFDEYNVQEASYKYNIRFNISNIMFPDHYMTYSRMTKYPFKINDQLYQFINM